MVENKNRDVPYSRDAEESVISACMHIPEFPAKAISVLQLEDFMCPACRLMFRAIKYLERKGRPIDQISVCEALKAHGYLEEVGGRLWVLKITDNTFSALNAEHHLEVVRRKSVQRTMILAGYEIISLGFSFSDDEDDLIKELNQIVDRINAGERRDFSGLSKKMTDFQKSKDGHQSKEKDPAPKG